MLSGKQPVTRMCTLDYLSILFPMQRGLCSTLVFFKTTQKVQYRIHSQYLLCCLSDSVPHACACNRYIYTFHVDVCVDVWGQLYQSMIPDLDHPFWIRDDTTHFLQEILAFTFDSRSSQYCDMFEKTQSGE
jgi:hypothetical protein